MNTLERLLQIDAFAYSSQSTYDSHPIINSGQPTTLCNFMIIMYVGSILEAGLLPCREGFFREEESDLCTPSCYTWWQNPPQQTIATDVAIGVASATGIVVGMAALVISFIMHKKMSEQ